MDLSHAVQQLALQHEAFPFRMATISATLGDTERAIEALEQVQVREPHRVGRLLIEPELASLRDHPRVVAARKAFDLP